MLYVSESYVNATENSLFGDSEVYETSYDTPGDLYRAMQREYGRCTSKVYIDAEGGPKQVGWVFQSRQRYEDAPDTYLREVWVTVHEAPPTKTTEYHYAAL